MSNTTTTAAGIRWRKLPAHSAFPGWVGIPYHPDGEPTPLFRYYVRSKPNGSLDAWCEVDTIVGGWAQFTVEPKEFATREDAQAACHSDWVQLPL